MLSVKEYRVKNLRSLQDTGWLELRPINIFVGKNSSGKSSLARVFPLLKQSAERRKQSPLLWYGRLVDFGSFADAVSTFAEPQEIELSLRFGSDEPLTLSRRQYASRLPTVAEDLGTVDVTLTLGEGAEQRTQVRKLTVVAFGVEVITSFAGGAEVPLTLSGSPLAMPAGVAVRWVQGVIFPQLRMLLAESTAARVSDEEFAAPRRRVRLGEQEVLTAVSRYVHGNTLTERKIEIADRLPLASAPALLQYCRQITGAPDTWLSAMSNARVDGFYFRELQKSLVIYKYDLLLAELDDALAAFCSRVSYLEPLRATAQRYYRREELSVDELDAKGLSTAFYFQGLLLRERDSLNRWLNGTFGFQISVRADRGHLALLIDADGSGAERNMADVGLGYSQLLPVAIQLWAARQPPRPTAGVAFAPLDRRRRPSPLVVVEQPELHLHPAFQGKLADVFAACVRVQDGDSVNPRVIAETHSPNLIGRLGELVGQGQVRPRDVSVLVFEPDENQPGATAIRRAEFDGGGVLQNWPVGFFDA